MIAHRVRGLSADRSATPRVRRPGRVWSDRKDTHSAVHAPDVDVDSGEQRKIAPALLLVRRCYTACCLQLQLYV